MSSCSRRRVAEIEPAIVIACNAPVLQIGFPPVPPGPNTVTLANGAVVDLNMLGEIISRFCPSIVCPTTVTLSPAMLGMDPTLLTTDPALLFGDPMMANPGVGAFQGF